jgi:hypothetical protein
LHISQLKQQAGNQRQLIYAFGLPDLANQGFLNKNY